MACKVISRICEVRHIGKDITQQRLYTLRFATVSGRKDKNMEKTLKVMLQLFAEEAEATETGVESGSPNHETAVTEVAEPTDRSEEFEKLITGDFKDEFNKRTHGIINDRMKSANSKIEAADKFRADVTPLLEHLADTYAVTDPTDIAKILEKVQNDKTYLEQVSLETGEDPDKIISGNRERREQEALKAEIDSIKKREAMEQWTKERISEAEKLKEEFPEFDFDEMLKNEDFCELVSNGKSMRNAYFYCNGENIVKRKAEAIEKKLSEKMSEKRPTENAAGNPIASSSKFDVNSLSNKDVLNILKQVENGAKISFNAP